MLQKQCYAQHRQLEIPWDPIDLTSHMAKGKEGWKPHMPTTGTENRVKTAQESLGEVKNHFIWGLPGSSVTHCKVVCTHWQNEQPQEDQ